MDIGIDYINFYTSSQAISFEEFARFYNIDVEKFHNGLGQFEMSIIDNNQDIISMACNAAYPIIKAEQSLKNEVDLVIFCTESDIDFSKSNAGICASLLGISSKARVIDFKNACHSVASAIDYAQKHVYFSPNSKVMIISSDVAFYGFGSKGESTQGCGAACIIISQNPRIASINLGEKLIHNKHEYDFFRPSKIKEPIVNGSFSVKCYMDIFEKLTQNAKNFDYICTHLPFASIAKKLQFNSKLLPKYDNLQSKIGNTYTSSIYISLVSGLLFSQENLSEKTILMYSYGSGLIGETFSINIKNEYQNQLEKTLKTTSLIAFFKARNLNSYDNYKKLWEDFLDRESCENFITESCNFRDFFELKEIKNHQRHYSFNDKSPS